MRKALILVIASLLLAGSHTLLGQELVTNGCSSAGNIGGPVRFNVDYPGFGSVSLYHRIQSGTSFSQAAMTAVGEAPYYVQTYETSVTFVGDPGILEYYFSVLDGVTLITQSPKNGNNQFPPSTYKYAQFIVDPQGDMAGGSAGNWLDIRGSGMSYSDTRLYCYLGNVSGTFPLSQLFDYFAYTCGFLISSGSDSSYYAMVYANVPLLLSSGLYRLDLSDSTFTRVGDISYNISGGLLHMASYFSEFSADPNWPGWPPPEGRIMPMAATLTAGLSGQFANDYTDPAIFQPMTQTLDFGSNAGPGLFSCGIESDSGISLNPIAGYFDSDNNLPITRLIHFDDSDFNLGSHDHRYADSSTFVASIPWPTDGWHRFRFEFSDGVSTNLTPLDSILIGSPGGCAYFPGDINGNGTTNGIDVTYGVIYFKGGAPPPVDCGGICPEVSPFYAAGDVNGNCVFNGIDISFFVNYLKGITPALQHCPDCPPAGL